MEHPPPSEDDGDPRMAISEVAVLRPSKGHVLPPIRQVVPQINAAIPPILTGTYPRQPCHSPAGFDQLSISGSSTPSPSKSQRIRSSPLLNHEPTSFRSSAWPTPEPSEGRPDHHLATLTGQSKHSSESYQQCDSADRRVSLASNRSSADRLRASPLLPSMPGLRASPQRVQYEIEEPDHVNLPSLFGNSSGALSNYSPRDRPSLYDARRDTAQTYPPMWDYDLPSPQTAPYNSLPYTQHRHASDSAQLSSNFDGSAMHGPGHQQLSFEMVGDYPDHRNKRRRGNLPKAVTDILRSWFHDHISHPYPSEDEKQILMARTGLTISQVRLTTLSRFTKIMG
ncbi:hypothetical protein MMC16_004052 [Acarospora aff. strigata]|nr:hypothetical protein [Acarospora aff. strigata]